ncbi:MAG: hypothetical protein ACQEXV_22295 [Bacillota bacterium]
MIETRIKTDGAINIVGGATFRNILFIGAEEKIELLLYLGRILTAAGKRVLIIDATAQQKYRYSIPEIAKGNLLTEYDGFDVATGFGKQPNGIHEVLQLYMKSNKERIESYDYILMDTDTVEFLSDIPKAPWHEIHEHILVTNSDRFVVERNAELLGSYIKDTIIPFARVQYPAVDTQVKEDYLDSVLSHLNIQFDDSREFEIYFDEADYAAKINNQYESVIRLKSLSRNTRKALYGLAKVVSVEDGNILKTAMKSAEKGK